MNNKILIFGVLVVLMLVSISFVSSAETNTEVEKKESPLWRIRNRQAVTEKIGTIMKNIRTSFIGENRLIFIPILENIHHRTQMFSVARTIMTCPYYCCK